MPDATLILSTRGVDGRYTFTVRERQTSAGPGGVRHFIGVASRASTDGARAAASLSISVATGRGYLYFSGRRNARPHAVTFRLTPSPTSNSTRVRLSSAPLTAIRFDCAHLSSEGSQARSADLVAQAALFTPKREMTVRTTADREFFHRYGAETQPYIDSIMQAADALYTSQIGLRLVVSGTQVVRRGSVSASSFDSTALLEAFRRSVQRSGISAGVHHLFTGKRLKGSTIGLAYLGKACQTARGFNSGLSRAVNRALQPIIAAHEIGHNLNAVHELTTGSIMNPVPRTTTTTFTVDTLERIRAYVDSFGGCLTTVSTAIGSR